MAILDRAIASTLPFIPKQLVHQVARRYIAGETPADALRVAAELNRKGFRATVDLLGEDIESLNQARHAADHYLRLLDEIHRGRIDSTVSLKLTQFGLKLDQKTCLDLTASVLRKAKELGNFVRLDMEDSSCTSAILETFRELRREFSNVGVAIQAYLRRTLEDVSRLEDIRPNYRLCKGVYVEPRDIAFREMDLINRNYVTALERMFRTGSYVGIATHDTVIIQEALRLIGELKLPATAYEFQMLLGVQEGLRDKILADGHPVRIYIPYGPEWYAYSVRRLRENPRLAGYVLKAFVGRG